MTDPSLETHIERINPGNPAAAQPDAAPGAPPQPADPAQYGPKRHYRLLADGVHDGVRLKAGAEVWLHDHEVGQHHERIAGIVGSDGRIGDRARY